MHDRLLTQCHVATMVARPGDPLGMIRDAALTVTNGRIARVGPAAELAAEPAAETVPLGGAWVTPGLVDCHTHLVFGGTRAAEHAMRRAGASYQEIAAAGGGIASTIRATAAASDDALLGSARRRLRALMAGGCTTVEVKSGYGHDPASELRLLEVARVLGGEEPVRIVPTLLALHALPPGANRAAFVAQAIDKLLPEAARRGLATAVDGFCEGIGFTPEEIERLFAAAADHGLRVKLHAEQLSNLGGAALAARYQALSADHLEHLDEAGAMAMAQAGTVGVLLPGAFYALNESRKPPVDLLRRRGVRLAVATDCNPGTSPLLNPQLAMNMACTLFGLSPEEALAGMTVNAAAALGLDAEVGTIEPGKAADLCAWAIEDPAELGYWIGLPGPVRRIVAGRDAPVDPRA
ncbi:imidazolonepropionase [Altererythrobacter aerius]|uniref:Imidazolonepropionase n=1 Tax=Tsuneonella aeria TaxID=1837929 RepID=A0A6I4THB4_9SPHN|nr:imidazolonepropionase [Tsuneonella aeria]MXO76004.1 imidazolonepropionase [Tsuneonella aeria]